MSWQSIYKASIPLLFSLSEKQTYAQIAKQAQLLVDGSYASIFMYEKGRMKRVYTTIPKLYQVIPRKNGLTMQTYVDGVACVRTKKELEGVSPIFHKLPINSDFMMPLSYENKVFGVLSVLSPKIQSTTKKDLMTLKRFMPMATMAIRDMQHREYLKKALKQRNLFIALASHELKTPLTSLTLYAQMLASNQHVGKKEQNIKKKLMKSVQQLTYVTNDLLQANKLNQGSMQFVMHPIDLKKIVRVAVSQFGDIHMTHTVTIVDTVTSGKARIIGDTEKLIQVILNLLNNSAKYSPDQPKITVKLTENSSYFIVEVIDQGIGISPQDMPNIFEQFYQGDHDNKQGFGIGLYLIKHIIAKHHGTIHVDSHVGQGTTMRVSLRKNLSV